MEIADGIHRIETDLGDRVNCLYLLVGDRHALLVDTGLDETPAAFLAPYLARTGVDAARIRWVLNTHCDMDHCGGNRSLRAIAPAADIVTHVADQAMVEDIERTIAGRYREFEADHGVGLGAETHDWFRANTRSVPVDIAVRGGERLRLGPDWEVAIVSTPGHSPGSISVHDPRSRSLIIGDAVLGDAILRRDGERAFPPTYRDVDQYLDTIAAIRAMPLDRLLTSHYPMYEGTDVVRFLDLSRAFVERLDAAVGATLRDRDLTMAELLAVLTTDGGPWPGPVAESLAYPVAGHLDRLVANGQVARIGGLPVTFRWQG